MSLKRLSLLLHLLAYIIHKRLCSRFQSSIHYVMFQPIFLPSLIKLFWAQEAVWCQKMWHITRTPNARDVWWQTRSLSHHFVTFICRSDVYFDRFYSFGPTCSVSGVTEAGLSNTKWNLGLTLTTDTCVAGIMDKSKLSMQQMCTLSFCLVIYSGIHMDMYSTLCIFIANV